jgi:predicted nucleotidyltransferase
MPYGLKTEYIERLNSTFSQFKEIDEVVLYGSRAKGNHKNSSDIDITIKGRNLSLIILNKISTEIDDLLFPYTFDISIYQHLKNIELIDHINRVGKVIYKKQG